MDNNELQHHGILGMKWGIRRYQNYDGTLTSAGKKRYAETNASDVSANEDYRQAHERNPVKTYSTKELQQIVNRLDLEKKYNAIDNETANKGKMTFDKLVKTAGTVAALIGTFKTISGALKSVGEYASPQMKTAGEMADLVFGTTNWLEGLDLRRG